MTVTVTLPYPPSANRLWRAIGGRNIKSGEYRTWEKAALQLVALQKRSRPTITGPYTMILTAERPDRRRRDVGNLEKPVSDLLVTAGIVSDDCNAEHITVCWAPGEPKGQSAQVRVAIYACEGIASSPSASRAKLTTPQEGSSQ